MEHEAKLEKYKALEAQLAKVTNENQKKSSIKEVIPS